MRIHVSAEDIAKAYSHQKSWGTDVGCTPVVFALRRHGWPVRMAFRGLVYDDQGKVIARLPQKAIDKEREFAESRFRARKDADINRGCIIALHKTNSDHKAPPTLPDANKDWYDIPAYVFDLEPYDAPAV